LGLFFDYRLTLSATLQNTHEGGAEAARRSSFRPRPPMDLTEPLHLCMGDWQTVLTMLTSYVKKGLTQLAALDRAVTSCDIKAIQCVTANQSNVNIKF
jgi:hypothetical protein